MKNAIIISAKYAPGHFSHMLAYYELFLSVGYESLLYLDKEYEDFTKEYPEYKREFISDTYEISADILFIYNMSTSDGRIISKFKKSNPNIKIYFVYHEPWMGISLWLTDLLKKRESVFDSIKTFARAFFVKPILKSSNMILLPSNKAADYYKKTCIKYNGNYIILPLVFTDETDKKLDLQVKKYFSFISTAQSSKNFTKFLEFIKYKAKKDSSARFQIATRSDITEHIDSQLKKLINEGRLIVNYGHPLSNAEINHAYAISECTWMLYNRSTQSGVLCKSFMFGTPVIASNVGSFCDAVNGTNGIILEDNYTLDDIDAAYEKIKNNFEALCEGARQTFLSRFYYETYVDVFKKIVCGDVSKSNNSGG